MGISESRILKPQYLNTNVSLQNYVIEKTQTESTAGGALLYINKRHSYKTRPDLAIYKPKKLESIFVEVVLPKKSNLIVGCIYKHPCMDICTFNDHYLNPLLDNLSKEANKTIVLLGDFNIDLLNFDTSEYVSTFLDDLASNSIILDQVEMVYYLFLVITQSDLGENQLSIQPLLLGTIFKLTEYNFLYLTSKSLKILLLKFFISEYNS